MVLVVLCVDDERPPFAFVMLEGVAETSADVQGMLPWSMRIAERYMGPELAEHYGKRNAVEGELGLRGSVDHEGEPAVRKLEVSYIPCEQPYMRIARQVRSFAVEFSRTPGQNSRARVQTKLTVDMAEALHQPAAKEACAARDENPLTTHWLPKRLGLAQNEIKIGAEKTWRRHVCSSLFRSECNTSRMRFAS